MRFVVYMILLIGSLPFALRWPFFALCAYLTISFAEPKVLCWRPDVQDSLMMGVALVAGAILFGVKRRDVRAETDPATGALTDTRTLMVRNAIIEPSLLLLPPLLLLAYIAMNWVGSEYPSPKTMASYSRLAKTVLVTLLMTGLTPDLRRLRILYGVVALAAGFWAIKGGLKVVALGPHQVYGADYDNNLFALKSVMALPMLYYFGITARRPRWRWLLLGCCALMCLAVLGSKSRSGFVALLFVLACLAWTSGRRIRAFFGVGVVATIAIALSWSDIQTRFDSIRDYRKDRSAQGRLKIWPIGWRLLSQNPMFGVGFENFERSYRKSEKAAFAAHNIWLQNLVELGLIGHPIWLSMIFGTMASLGTLMWRARRGPPPLRRCYYWARGILLGLCAFWIHGMFHNEEYLDLMFAFIGLTAVLQVVYARELRHLRLTNATSEAAAPTPDAAPQPVHSARPPLAWIIPTPTLLTGRKV